MSATPRRNSESVASRIRSSVPSGSTMCLRSCRARSISRNWNISGVVASLRPASMTASNASVSTLSANTRSAMSTFTFDFADSCPLTPPRAVAVSNVPRSVTAIGRSPATPAISLDTDSGGR